MKQLKLLHKTGLLLFALIGFIGIVDAQTFIHPGLLHPQADNVINVTKIIKD
jgi:hypothetical protein